MELEDLIWEEKVDKRGPQTVSWGTLTCRGWRSGKDSAKNTEEEKPGRLEDQETDVLEFYLRKGFWVCLGGSVG